MATRIEIDHRTTRAAPQAPAEAALRASNARLEALLAEVNHRVANSLQLVSAMVRLQAGSVTDAAARAALEDTERRIVAIAHVHRRLYTGHDVEHVDMRDYLAQLIRELSETWSTTDRPRSLLLDAESVQLPTDRAVSLGVIVTELVSNACKYAYGDSDDGEIRVSLRRADESSLELAVLDDGAGMPSDGTARGTGLGTRLIEALARTHKAAVSYGAVDASRDMPGTRAAIRIQLRPGELKA